MSVHRILTFGPGALRRRLWASFFAAFLLLPGCASTRRVEPITPGPMPARQTVEVWRGSRAITLHKVRVGEGELVGIPHLKPVECDSCRITIPLSEVDSMNIVPGDHNALLATGLVIGTFLTVMLAWNAAERD